MKQKLVPYKIWISKWGIVSFVVVLIRKPKERDNMEELGTDDRLLLKWILKKYDLKKM
jgi:hypothetical protein